MRLSLVAGLVAYCFCAPTLAQETEAVADSKQSSTQTAETFEVTMKLNYLLHLPADYQSKADGGDKKWPLLLFLHGAGERGSDLNRVKSHGPPKLVEKDPDFPFVLISPQCPGGGFWNTEHLLQLIQSTIEAHNIDPDRVYLTGLSMGGFGSWALAAEAPERFAAVAPVCGGGDPRTAGKLKDMPIWVFHGDADRVVPISSSQRMVDAVKEAGNEQIEFTIYKDVGHDSWTETYANKDLYSWFLKHQRSKK